MIDLTPVFYTIEAISVFLMLVRWSKRFHAGEYPSFVDSPEVVGYFLGAIIVGLLSPIALAYFLGGYLHNREVKGKGVSK